MGLIAEWLINKLIERLIESLIKSLTNNVCCQGKHWKFTFLLLSLVFYWLNL